MILIKFSNIRWFSVSKTNLSLIIIIFFQKNVVCLYIWINIKGYNLAKIENLLKEKNFNAISLYFFPFIISCKLLILYTRNMLEAAYFLNPILQCLSKLFKIRFVIVWAIQRMMLNNLTFPQKRSLPFFPWSLHFTLELFLGFL